MLPPSYAGYGAYTGAPPPQGYGMPPGMQAQAPPGSVFNPEMATHAPPGYVMPQGMQPQANYGGYPPGQNPDAVPVPGYMHGYPQQQAYIPPGYPPTGMGGMPQHGFPGFGFNHHAPGVVVFPMGQIPQEFAAQAAFAAFSQGLPPSMYDGMARMMGVPQRNENDTSDPRNQVKRGAWETGLCGCCDSWIPNGCMACVCPCVSLAQISRRLGNYRYQAAIFQFAVMWIFPVIGWVMPQIMIRSMMSGDDLMELPAVMNLILLFPLLMTAVIVTRLRWTIRIRFQIPGSCCGDCAAGCCLWPCAIAQIATHVKSYTPGSCSFDPPDMLPPFV